jgi:dolichol-phosphate mannosyltransferase
MKVTVVLPTYNEAGNIVALIEAILSNMPAHCDPEIIVVDDNSPDGTYDLVRKRFGTDPKIKAVRRTRDRGLANSIRDGLNLASGEQVLVMDTDFTHSPAEIPRMLHVAQAYGLVSGSRFCAGGAMEDVAHYLASLLYNFVLRIVLRTQIQDNLGGFFTMRRNDLQTLPWDEIFHGYGDYFFRLLSYVQAAGLTIVEVPALYRVRSKGASKSHFLRLLGRYTREVVKFRAKRGKGLPACRK